MTGYFETTEMKIYSVEMKLIRLQLLYELTQRKHLEAEIKTTGTRQICAIWFLKSEPRVEPAI